LRQTEIADAPHTLAIAVDKIEQLLAPVTKALLSDVPLNGRWLRGGPWT
jgi:hypothetical protein